MCVNTQMSTGGVCSYTYMYKQVGRGPNGNGHLPDKFKFVFSKRNLYKKVIHALDNYYYSFDSVGVGIRLCGCPGWWSRSHPAYRGGYRARRPIGKRSESLGRGII